MNNLEKWMISEAKRIAENLGYMDTDLTREGLLAALILSLADIKNELHELNRNLRRGK